MFEMLPALDAPLKDACVEYKRMGNIDVFNNFVAWAYNVRVWRRMGCPKEITNGAYAVSPWVATLNRLKS